MLEIAKFYLNQKALPVYLADVPGSPRELDRDDLFYLRMSELLDFYNIESPQFDRFDDQSIARYTQFVASHFSAYHLSTQKPSFVPGDPFLSWRSYFALDDLLPDAIKHDYFWLGAQVEHYLMNYTGGIRKTMKAQSRITTFSRTDPTGQPHQEVQYMVTGMSLAVLHRSVTLDTLADTLENPFGFGICAADYRDNQQDYLTEDELAVAMSKLLRQRIDRRKLSLMLVESNLLEVDPKTKAKRYSLTHIGKNYGFDRPRTWHRSVVTLLENKGID